MGEMCPINSNNKIIIHNNQFTKSPNGMGYISNAHDGENNPGLTLAAQSYGLVTPVEPVFCQHNAHCSCCKFDTSGTYSLATTKSAKQLGLLTDGPGLPAGAGKTVQEMGKRGSGQCEWNRKEVGARLRLNWDQDGALAGAAATTPPPKS